MMSYVPPLPEFDGLPYICVCLFLAPEDVEAAEAALKTLKPSTRAKLAAALEVATTYAKGYRIEYAEIDEDEPAAVPVVVPPVVSVRRSPFSGWRA